MNCISIHLLFTDDEFAMRCNYNEALIELHYAVDDTIVEALTSIGILTNHKA